MQLTVPYVNDFTVTGDGADPAWQAAEWVSLARVGSGQATYATRAKVLYSATGLYVLAECEDARLTNTLTEDFANLFTEDVIEVFIWPHADQIVYFEYEISPLGYELPILVANHGGKFYGWLPWHFEGGRRTRKATATRGGAAAPGAAVTGWSTEFFIPFALLTGLGTVPPAPGDTWRANIYRIDYDATPSSQWAWCPDTGANFHDYAHFGTLVFA